MKKVLMSVLVVFILFAGYVFYKSGYVRYYIFHKGMPPGYCDPGPCEPIGQSKSTSVQTTSDTSNWKTYTNTKYGFEFSYPSIYTAKIFDPSEIPGNLLYVEIVDLARTDMYPSIISIIVSDNSKQLSLLDWSKANRYISTYSSISDFKDETLFGHKAISYSWQGEDGFGKRVTIENNQTIILLNTTVHSKTDKFLQDFDSVLSTFKFTK